MNFYEYWKSLSEKEKSEFAKKTEISENYIAKHLVYRRKMPPLDKIKRMADVSNGQLNFHQLCDFFVERHFETA